MSFAALGRIHAQFPKLIILVGFVVTVIFSIGNSSHHMEKEIPKMWIGKGSRVYYENQWIEKLYESPTSTAKGKHLADLLLTSNSDHSSALTKKTLLAHRDMLDELMDLRITYPVEEDGDTLLTGTAQSYHKPNVYSFHDFCQNMQPYAFQCVRLTVLDCFKQGAWDLPLVIHNTAIQFSVDTVVLMAFAPVWGDPDAKQNAMIQGLTASGGDADLAAGIASGFKNPTACPDPSICAAGAAQVLVGGLMVANGMTAEAATAALPGLTSAQKDALIDGWAATLTATSMVVGGMVPAYIEDLLEAGTKDYIKGVVVDMFVAEIVANHRWKADIVTTMHYELLATPAVIAKVTDDVTVAMTAAAVAGNDMTVWEATKMGQVQADSQEKWTAQVMTPNSELYNLVLHNATELAGETIKTSNDTTLTATLKAYVAASSATPGRGAHTYAGLQDLNDPNLTDEMVQAKVQSNQCWMWDQGQAFPVVDLGLTAGPKPRFWAGATFTDDIKAVTSLEIVSPHLMPRFVANRLSGKTDFNPNLPSANAMLRIGGMPDPPPSEDDAEEILLKFHAALEKAVQAKSKVAEKEEGIWHGAFLSSSFEEELSAQEGSDNATYAAGYMLVLAYAMAQFFSCSLVRSRTMVGLASFVTVVCGVLGGLGLCSFFNISTNLAIVSVLPFVMLGIGVDDSFIMVYNFPMDQRDKSLSDVMAQFMSEIGPSVTLTSLTNVAVFLIASMIPIPLVTDFSTMAAVIMFFIWTLVLFVFPAFLALDEMRRRENRYDILCCSKGTADISKTPPQSFMSKAVEKVYAPAITSVPGIALSLLTLIVLLSVSASGIEKVEMDLNVIDVLDNDSPIRPAVKERFEKFASYSWTIFYKNMNVDTPEMQLRTLAAYERAMSVDYVAKNTYHPWHLFYLWATAETSCTSVYSDSSATRSAPRAGCSNPTCNSANAMSGGRCGPLYGCHVGFFPAPKGIGLHNTKMVDDKVVVDTPLCMTKPALEGLGQAVKGGVIAGRGDDIISFLFAYDMLNVSLLKGGLSLTLKANYTSAASLAVLDGTPLNATNGQKGEFIDEYVSPLNPTNGLFTNDIVKTMIFDGYFKMPTYADATSDEMYCPAMAKDSVTENVPWNLLTGELHPTHIRKSRGFQECWSLWQEKDGITALYGGEVITERTTDAYSNETFATFHADGLASNESDLVWKKKPVFTDSGAIELLKVDMKAESVDKGIDFTNLIKDVRRELHADPVLLAADNTGVFPSGIPFMFWEQYVTIMHHLVQKATYAGIVCMLSVSTLVTVMSLGMADKGTATLMFASLHGSFLVLVMCLVTMLEMYGFMGLVGIKLNAIPQVTLIMAIGMTIEFTAHILLAYLHAPEPADAQGYSFKSRRARAMKALNRMAVPSMHGAFTTFLGIVMLANAKMQFVRLYYFVLYALLVLFGIINGLLVLPALLTLCGPVAITTGKASNVINSNTIVPAAKGADVEPFDGN